MVASQSLRTQQSHCSLVRSWCVHVERAQRFVAGAAEFVGVAGGDDEHVAGGQGGGPVADGGLAVAGDDVDHLVGLRMVAGVEAAGLLAGPQHQDADLALWGAGNDAKERILIQNRRDVYYLHGRTSQRCKFLH